MKTHEVTVFLFCELTGIPKFQKKIISLEYYFILKFEEYKMSILYFLVYLSMLNGNIITGKTVIQFSVRNNSK